MYRTPPVSCESRRSSVIHPRLYCRKHTMLTVAKRAILHYRSRQRSRRPERAGRKNRVKVRNLFLFIVPFLARQTTAQQPPQFAELNVYDDFVQSRGAWLPDNLTEKNEPIPSVVDLACYRHGGILLVNSDAYCIAATAQIMSNEPNIDVTYYPVLSWDKNRIVAADSQEKLYLFAFGQKSQSI